MCIRDNPKLDVRILSGKASELAGKVEDGELDAAFLVEAGRKMASTRWTPLYEDCLLYTSARLASARVCSDGRLMTFRLRVRSSLLRTPSHQILLAEPP